MAAPTMISFRPTAILLFVALLAPASAVAHHPGEREMGLATRIDNATLSFHYRDAKLESLGQVAPVVVRAGDAIEVRFTASVRGEQYKGIAHLVFLAEDGTRSTAEARPEGTWFVGEVVPPGSGKGTLRMELPQARGIGVNVPVEVQAGSPQLLLFGLVGAAALLLVVFAFGARREERPGA